MLELIDLTAGYHPNQPILNGLNLRLESGERVAILGQNGAGKSTIGKAIMGLVPYIEGEIRWNGKSIKGLTPGQLQELGIGYFMQGGQVFAHLTAEENLQLATQNLPKPQAQQQIEKTKSQFDFFANLQRTRLNATYLSGGERHQLALAMVFAANPYLKLLIADEPSAGVAVAKLGKLTKELISVLNKTQASMLLIEQNQTLAKEQTSKQEVIVNGKIEP